MFFFLISYITRQVYNRPRSSNLSQQQQKRFCVKSDFWTTKSKKKCGKIFSEKESGKKIWNKIFLLEKSCPNLLLHHSVIMWYHTKKVKKMTKSQKRGLATAVQPVQYFSRTCAFREVLGINEDCLNTKYHRNR